MDYSPPAKTPATQAAAPLQLILTGADPSLPGEPQEQTYAPGPGQCWKLHPLSLPTAQDWEPAGQKRPNLGLCPGSNVALHAGRIPMDRGAWRATVHGVAKSQTRMKQPSRHTHLQVAYIISTQFQAHSFTLTTRGLKKWDIPMSPDKELVHFIYLTKL